MKVTLDGSGKTLEVWPLPGRRVGIRIHDGGQSLEVVVDKVEAATVGLILVEYAKG